jgi:glycosyltransferase 2 family protein
VKQYWKLALGLLISIVALFFTLRGIHFDEFLSTLAHAQVIWLLPAFGALMVVLGVRTWRWSWLMGGTPFWLTLHAVNIGYMLNSTLPFRLGEIGRAYVIGERTNVRMTRALSTVVVERLLDLASVVVMFAVFAQFIPLPPVFATAALTGAVVVIGLLLAFALAIWQAARVEIWLYALAQRVPQLHAESLVRRFHDLVGGFNLIRSPRKLLTALALTAGVWFATLFVAFFTLMAFKQARMDEVGLVVVLSNLGGALPSAPGGLGVVQFFAKQSLVVPFQVPEDVAVAFAFVWSLSQQIILIILGLFGLLRVGMTFSSVSSSTQANTASPPIET